MVEGIHFARILTNCVRFASGSQAVAFGQFEYTAVFNRIKTGKIAKSGIEGFRKTVTVTLTAIIS